VFFGNLLNSMYRREISICEWRNAFELQCEKLSLFLSRLSIDRTRLAVRREAEDNNR
jgi:hypothetical protein